MNLTKQTTDPYRPKTAPAFVLAAALALFSIMLFVIFSLLAHQATDKRLRDRAMVKDYLCTVETPCSILLTAECDKEPVSIEVEAPDGSRITQINMDSFVIEENTITAVIPAETIGDYYLKYNRLTNNHIKFNVSQRYLEKVIIMDAELVRGEKTGALYLKFTPVWKDGSDTETKLHASATIAMNPTGMSRIAYNGEVTMNKTNTVELDTEGFPAGNYWVDISTSSETTGYSELKRLELTISPDEVKLRPQPTATPDQETGADSAENTDDSDDPQEGDDTYGEQ